MLRGNSDVKSLLCAPCDIDRVFDSLTRDVEVRSRTERSAPLDMLVEAEGCHWVLIHDRVSTL